MLEVKNLTKRFGELMAVKDMHFEVAEGEIFGIAGPNGSGKTTIFNLIAGKSLPPKSFMISEGLPCPQERLNRYLKNTRIVSWPSLVSSELLSASLMVNHA